MFSEPNRLGGITKPYPSWMGADHADDLQYVFGKPFTTPLGYWPRHRDVSGYMIAYWTNFAKTGYNYNLINNIKSLKISVFLNITEPYIFLLLLPTVTPTRETWMCLLHGLSLPALDINTWKSTQRWMQATWSRRWDCVLYISGPASYPTSM